MPVSRRVALKALALPVAGGLTGLGTAGCAASGPALNVAVVWTGWELRQFQKVLEEFTRTTGIRCQLLSMGDDVNAFLGNEVTSAAQPDVALVPQPGTVLSNRHRLMPQSWPSQDADSWRGLLADQHGTQYGVWYKTANMSMVWHRAGMVPADVGRDWDTWTQWCVSRARGGQAPLAIGAADGWVLADWFSNVLLAFSPDSYANLVKVYRDLAVGIPRPALAVPAAWTDSGVRHALSRLAGFWRHEGLFPGGAERALATQFDQSVLDVFGTGDAMMVPGADYYWPIITQYTSFPRSGVGWLPFPGAAPGQHPVITAGDAAVQFSTTGGELIRWLTNPEAAAIWARQGGFLSIDRQVPLGKYPYPGTMNAREMVMNVQSKAAQFNLSDLLSGALTGGDGEGAWKIFTDFFADAALRRTDPATAAANAVNALASGAGGA